MDVIIDVMEEFAASIFMGAEEFSFFTTLITTYGTMNTRLDM
jgi:hypothetical protein